MDLWGFDHSNFVWLRFNFFWSFVKGRVVFLLHYYHTLSCCWDATACNSYFYCCLATGILYCYRSVSNGPCRVIRTGAYAYGRLNNCQYNLWNRSMLKNFYQLTSTQVKIVLYQIYWNQCLILRCHKIWLFMKSNLF